MAETSSSKSLTKPPGCAHFAHYCTDIAVDNQHTGHALATKPSRNAHSIMPETPLHVKPFLPEPFALQAISPRRTIGARSATAGAKGLKLAFQRV